MSLIGSLVLLLGFSQANAVEVEVLKVKGNSAIVKFPSGSAPKAGDTLHVNEAGSMNSALSGLGLGARRHRLAGSFTYASGSSSDIEGFKLTSMVISAAYGWNMGVLEFGPTLSYGSETQEATGVPKTETSNRMFGGFAEYNFVENKPGANMVPHAGGGVLMVAQEQNGVSADGFGYSVYGGVKFFFLNDSTAFIPKVNYAVTSVENNGNDFTTKTFGLMLEISNYF